MHDLEKQNAALTAEANLIIKNYGLLKILSKYGRPYVTGSYVLGLMTRRDLDVNIRSDNMTEDVFSRLREETVGTLQMQNTQYLNEFVERHPRLPLGFYIGGSTQILGKSREWYLDIWSMDTHQFKTNQESINIFLSMMTPEKRLCILEIKHECLPDSGYQHRYFSVDIYKAVMEDGITNSADFFKWVDKNLTVDRSN